VFSLTQLRRLYPSIKEHQQVEVETRNLLAASLDERYIAPSPKTPGMLTYAQRHIFSILFLSIYRSLGIAPERRVFYGVLNHSIRGIVTATDNILDDEYKELLPLRFSEDAPRFKSVMHILLFDRFLARTLDNAAERGLILKELKEEISKRVFDAMVPIGAEEASEEGGVREILHPYEILSSVHMYKGGNLLRLAFVAPRIVEKHLTTRLSQADEGVYRIGMALQVIDDLTDFYCDIGDHRHNYLVSSVRHEGTADEKERLGFLLERLGPAQPPIEKAFAPSVGRVMNRAIGEALVGFDLLHEAGFWMDRKLAIGLIHQLFRLRGVPNLLALLPVKKIDFTTTLISTDHSALRDRITEP
jgi:hypothetical protein